jgi:hypothetical protein
MCHIFFQHVSRRRWGTVRFLRDGSKLALKLEQGKANEFDSLACIVTGYRYIGLCMVSANVHVSTHVSAMKMWQTLSDGGTFTASHTMVTFNILNLKECCHSVVQITAVQFSSESP